MTGAAQELHARGAHPAPDERPSRREASTLGRAYPFAPPAQTPDSLIELEQGGAFCNQLQPDCLRRLHFESAPNAIF